MARDLIEWVTDQLLLLHACYEATKRRSLKITRLQKHIDRLKKVGLLLEDQKDCYSLPKDGLKLIQSFQSILERNKAVRNLIAHNADLIMNADFEGLLNAIYRARNPLNEKLTIDDTPMKQYLLSREMKPVLSGTSEFQPFEISEDEAEDLEVLLDPQLKRKMDEGNQAVRDGKLEEWVPTE
ncbi:MAG: hypothetical protein ACXAB7_14715 [Candidatus Kariarchaeaceae archaeon]|jgi:hypothetical protein